MSHKQYTFPQNHTQNFAEQLLYISLCTYEQDWLNALHSHTFFEMIFGISGKGFLCFEDEKIPIQKNTVAIINPNMKHTEISSKEGPLTYVVIGVKYIEFHKFNTTGGYHTFSLLQHNETLHDILQHMITEVSSSEPHYETICQNYLSILLLKISRYLGHDFTTTNEKKIPYGCIQAKTYIDNYFSRPITLEVLSEVSHMNKYYLSHLFKEHYNISPINYLIERRILRCQELLKDFDFTISQIADMTGFTSSNYLSQIFKKYTNCSPNEYRKLHAKK